SEDEILKNTIVSTIGLSAGKHILCVRTKDASGHWSLQESRPFEVKPKITDAEYFFDADPGVGYGVAVSVNDAETEITKSVQVPTTCLSQGVHYLYLRTRDNLGHWSLFEPDTLTISGVSVEICGNLLDDDCDGYVDEECSPIVNDTFAGATNVNISGSAYPAGNCFNGSLIGTSVSPQGTSANVAVGGGQDIWYKIIAPSAALRVVASTSSMNIVLELHDALGVQVDMENDDAGIGAEYMNTTGLTEGATYYIAVRSYDGVLGSFSVCVQALMDSHCADGSGTYELCSSFKSSWTGANTYTYNFTPTAPTPGVPTTVSGGGQISLSTIALALRHGGTYDVTIDVTYNLPEGEIITVPGTDVCAITIAPHASVEAKVQQRCPAVLLKGSVLQGKPFVCGAINFTVEFTAVNSCAGTFETGLPFTVNTLGAASNLSLSFTSPQALMNNTYYKVRFRPTFSYGAGNWGLPQIIFIGGSSMNVVDDLNAMLDDEKMDDVMSVSLYPNPNKGELLNTNLTGIESDEVFIRVMDNTGKLIYNNRYVVDGSLNAVVVFEQHLASGLYMVEFIAGEKVFVEKMMVEK
ncbi:MAG: T9SS type A sorting domain-containing protein, partial [Flavobacteriales bacterium]